MTLALQCVWRKKKGKPCLNASPPQTRILILMSDTGGGHRASAQALKAGFTELYGDRFQVEIIDLITDFMPFPLNQLPKNLSLSLQRCPLDVEDAL